MGEEAHRNRDDHLSKSKKLFREFLKRKESGEDVIPEEYLTKYPELEDDLKQFFSKLKAQDAKEINLAGESTGDSESDKSPQILGDFRIIREIGHGGMGTVYEAEQISLKRKVALKVLPSHLSFSDEAVLKFKREAEAGGKQSHRGIVAIHAVGEEEGVHYIAQELVEGGRTLADALEVSRHSIEIPSEYYRESAELFAEIAEALGHAHSTGVIHRDIKPSNILLTGEGRPKVTDFGLAKVEDALALSRTGDFAGTPYYMSPEQAASRRIGIDHRTDIFSLGVTFYETLTFTHAFDGDTSQQVLKKILLDDPIDPRKLRSRIPRDLSVVCLKAMEKKPEHRYQSTDEFAADLRRFLSDEPILAKPLGPVSRTLKWTRRHPVISMSGAVAMVAFVAILGLWWRAVEAEKGTAAALAQVEKEKTATAAALETATMQRDRAVTAEAQVAEERDKAEQRAEELQQVSDFQAAQLSGIDVDAMGLTIRTEVLERARAAGERAGRTTEVLEEERSALERLLSGADFTGLALGVLDEHVFEGALEALEDFGNQPLLQAQLLQTLADTLRALGLLDRALEPQRKALEIRRRELGDEHPDTLLSLNNLGSLLQAQGDLTEAEAFFRKALEVRCLTLGQEHPDTLTSLNDLGWLLHLQGKLNEAEPLLRQALEGRRRTLGDEHPETLYSLNSLGPLLQAQGKFVEAEALIRESLEVRRRTLGDEHPFTLSSLNNLSLVLQDEGKIDEAELLLREVVEGMRRTLGAEHPDTLTSLNNLGCLLRDQGKLTEAELLLKESLEVHRRTLGDMHPNTLTSLYHLGYLLKGQGKLAEAELLLRQALEGRRRTLGDEHPDTLSSLNSLGLLLEQQGKLNEAEALIRESLEVSRRTLGVEHPSTLSSLYSLCLVL